MIESKLAKSLFLPSQKASAPSERAAGHSHKGTATKWQLGRMYLKRVPICSQEGKLSGALKSDPDLSSAKSKVTYPAPFEFKKRICFALYLTLMT